jgi:hypothetical protein
LRQKHAVKKCANAIFWLFIVQIVLAKFSPPFAKNRVFCSETNGMTLSPNCGTVLDNSLKRRTLSGQWQQHGRTADEAYYGDHQTLQAR